MSCCCLVYNEDGCVDDDNEDGDDNDSDFDGTIITYFSII